MSDVRSCHARYALSDAGLCAPRGHLRSTVIGGVIAGRVASAQGVHEKDRARGRPQSSDHHRFSAGMPPFKPPLCSAVVVPVSFIGGTSTAGGRIGLEDVLLSARYRLEAERFRDALGLDESYFMVSAALKCRPAPSTTRSARVTWAPLPRG